MKPVRRSHLYLKISSIWVRSPFNLVVNYSHGLILVISRRKILTPEF
ncbi:MAG: hypothetical protein V7K27_04720 [Nostoc sp.]